MELSDLMTTLERRFKPYRESSPTFARLPEAGLKRAEILEEVGRLAAAEEERWRQGHASGAVYHGDPEFIGFLADVYAAQSQSNPLHPDVWPSALKFEAEVVSMTAHMLGAGEAGDEVVGTVTSGGTESILLAMKAYRDRAGELRGVSDAEVVVPVTAHAAFDKAAQYLGLELVRVPVDDEFRADAEAVRAAITESTVAVVGSAPSFPHGVVDPIPELAEIALEREVGFHVDACLGGFVLPWAERLGYQVLPFDFRLAGVTSMSADTHKYGYAPKGSSVVLYRGADLRRHQYYTAADWPGGLYFSPTMAGSRPGALSVACWAAMVAMGEGGYLDATRRILETGAAVRAGIAETPGLRVLGDPLWVIAFASDDVDVYRVMDRMAERGWSLNGLQRPPAVHLAVTLRHAQPGVAERFLEDLRAAVADVEARPEEQGELAPIYGMAAALPEEAVRELLGSFVDMLYTV